MGKMKEAAMDAEDRREEVLRKTAELLATLAPEHEAAFRRIAGVSA